MTPQEQSIPYGYCHCGCGKTTTIAQRNDKMFGYVIGVPRRFRVGHQARIRPSTEEAVPFKINGVYCRLISLGRDLYTIVNESDYVWLMQWKWGVRWSERARAFYVGRTEIVAKKTVRIIMSRAICDAPSDRDVDHANHNTFDNTRKNLRICTTSENVCNSRRRVTNRSGHKGVDFMPSHGKWRARITIQGETIHLGMFGSRDEAIAEYTAAAIRLHRNFAFIE